MKFVPNEDYLLVELTVQDEKTIGGIILPESAQETGTEGKIIATGVGKYSHEYKTHAPMNFKVGDIVVFGKYAGIEVELERKKYKLFKTSEILGTKI